MQSFKVNALTAAVVLAVASPAAFAVDAKISGHVNRALMNVDDGDRSVLHHVDNNASQTRLRFTGSEDIGAGMKAGINWEVGYSSNVSSSVTQTNRSLAGPDMDERIVEAYVSGAFGKVSMGQGPGAADGNVERDLSGTGVVSGALSYLLGADINFLDNGVAGPMVDQVINSQDFESRYDRVRYDSPKLGPVVISLSQGVKANTTDPDDKEKLDVTELGVRIDTPVGGGKLSAAVGSSVEEKNGAADSESTVGGSISWLAPFGLNVTAATSTVSDDNDANPDATWTMLKVGYKFGEHAVSVMSLAGVDQNQEDDTATSLGLGYVFKPTKTVELYAGYSVYSLDRDGADYDDITVATLGTRIKF